ncbi:MAG: menaquinone biosynthesis protein [Desulfuromonadales bacterium]|nr:menaquinone biosynthesis protein [Desulfuromonadales bacterium]
MALRIGHIAYANCVPFFHYLRQCGFSGEILSGVPAELNALLAAGEIDLAPSSSFEYGRNASDYLLLPGHSISSCGAVQSVLLFSPLPLEELGTTPIDLTSESATSVNLLKLLLGEFLGKDPCCCRPVAHPAEEIAAQGGSVLMIGDRALRTAQELRERTNIYDLGELWWRFTGLPFVFALWIVRAAIADEAASTLRLLQQQLAQSRQQAFADLPLVAAQTPERLWMGEAALVDYWRAMSYDLTLQHQAGLKLYFALCVRYGLLKEEPVLRFFTG